MRVAAKSSSTSPSGVPPKRLLQPDLQRFGVDDGAEVHADRRGRARVAQVPPAVGLHQALPAVVGAQRIAAGGGEIEAGVEVGAGEGGVGAGGA